MNCYNEIENSPIENIFISCGDKINKLFIKYVTLINDFLNYSFNNLNNDSIPIFIKIIFKKAFKQLHTYF